MRNGKSRWSAPSTGGFVVFQLEGFNAVVPQSDIKPHDWDKLSCHCGAQVTMEEGDPHVIHNSFEDRATLEASLSALGL